MDINLSSLNYQFSKKPLLVGGRAMEYYGLRKSGDDIDLIAPEEDVVALIKMYPNCVKDLYGDLGVGPGNFEIWSTICFFNYDDLKEDAVEKDDYLIISKEKLLFMKTLAIKIEKYLNDTKLIVEDILNNQYKRYEEVKLHNQNLLADIKDIEFIEKLDDEKESFIKD